MLPNCKQIAELASENLDTPLTGIARLKMKIHLMMCKHCGTYVHQMQLSSKTIGFMDTHSGPNDNVKDHVEKHYREIHCGQASDGSK